jgi:hypothetical protein
MKVHKFNKLEQANEAISLINKGEKIPAFPDSESITYTMPIKFNDFWYISADEVTQKYIETTTEITIE